MIALGLLVSCLAITNGATLSSRVIGGSTAPDNKYPYLVSLRIRDPGRRDFFLCGGAIINQYWILTAAHCIRRRVLENAYVVAGTNYLSRGGKSYKIWLTITHPKYYDGEQHDDIALLRIKGRIKFDKHVQPVALPSRDIETSESSVAAFAGWGSTTGGGKPVSDALQELPLTVISNDLCHRKQPTITKDHICTLTGFGKGACSGDSGSPLVVDGVQLGIAAFVRMPCASGHPDGFTRVSSYVDWIRQVLEEYAPIIPR